MRDKYKTWWNQRSDFALHLFRERPLFFKHLLEGDWQRAGTLLDDAFDWRDEGLWAEAEVEDNPAGLRIMELVRQGVAAWSSGTMPNLMRVALDGYVEKWAIVEGSVLHRDHAGSLPDTTTVTAVRAYVGDKYDFDRIERSYWIMPTENGNSNNGGGAQTPAPSAPAPDFSALTSAITALNTTVESLRAKLDEEPARRQLPPNGDPLKDARNQPADVTVRSKFDDVSLFGMVIMDQMARLNTPQGVAHKRSEEFMRALTDKVRAQSEIDDKKQAEDPGYLRCVDTQAHNDWHKIVPHLRANEAMQSTLATSGDELVPTLLNSTAYYNFRLQSRVMSLFPSMMVPSVPFDYPTVTSTMRLRKLTEPTDRQQLDLANSYIPTAKPVTAKITFNPKELGVMSIYSKTLAEDALVSVADVLATSISRDTAKYLDDILINGDTDATTTNISHYGTNPSGTVYDGYLQLDGLRKIAFDNSDSVSVGAIAAESLIAVLKLMGPRGIIGTDLANLVVLIDPGVYWKLLALDDFQTVEKIGARATFLTGQVASWYGIPLVLTDELEYTNSSGQIEDSHDGTLGNIVAVNRQLMMIGSKRGITMEASAPPHTGLHAMSVTTRLDLKAMEAGAVAYGYNATVA